MQIQRLWACFVCTICLGGCTVGPDYQRPDYPVPDDFRGQGKNIPTQPAEASFGDLQWFEVFKDEKLQEPRGVRAAPGRRDLDRRGRQLP